jgi:hypothetical protein
MLSSPDDQDAFDDPPAGFKVVCAEFLNMRKQRKQREEAPEVGEIALLEEFHDETNQVWRSNP